MADPTRLRIMTLLEREELSVQEMQEITHMGQSRISTHLGLLQQANLVQSRREGKRTYYRLNLNSDAWNRDLLPAAMHGGRELPDYAADHQNIKRVLALRQDQAKLSFNQVAGRFDRSYGPGRSWQALGHLLLRVLPPLVIADLGSGEGLISELLARRARKVIAVDNSEKMVAFGSVKARKCGLKNLEFRLGDLENPPLEPNSVDLVLMSQSLHHARHPARAIANASKILRTPGQIMVLDLLLHDYQPASEMFGDLWLGFTEGDLYQWLDKAGFKHIEVKVVAREEQPPHFQTVLASGEKSSLDI